MTIGLSDRQDNPWSTACTPRTALAEASFRWHGFSTILTHKRASRITASHLNGKSHAGPRHLCRKAPWTLAGGNNQESVPLDRSNLRLLLSRHHQTPEILGFIEFNPKRKELHRFMQLFRGNEPEAVHLDRNIFNFPLLVTDGAYPPPYRNQTARVTFAALQRRH